MIINLSLPWPPSVNAYYRAISGRSILSKKGREYKREVCMLARVNRWGKHLAGRLEVRVLLHPPTRARRDIDNSIKALLDAMQVAGVYLDDSQIDLLVVERGAVQRPGMAIVEVVER